MHIPLLFPAYGRPLGRGIRSQDPNYLCIHAGHDKGLSV